MDNLELQLQCEVASFDFFSLASDESCDVRDTAQLLIFVRDNGLQDYGGAGSCAVDERLTDSLSHFWRSMRHEEQSDISYHTALRWLSLGKVLKRVWDLKAEIPEFCETKGKEIPELSDEDWMADFAFAVDVTALMNELNTKLQGKGLFVHEMHSLVKAFMRKMLSSQLESKTLTHMQTLKEVTPSADHLSRYSSMLGALHGEFSGRFEDVRTIEDEMRMISSPFTCSVDNAPSDVQLELIDLQSDAVLAEDFKSKSLLDFYSSFKKENFPNMRRHAQKMLVLFGSTYTREQTFSMMKFTKSRYRSSLTDDLFLKITVQ